MTKNKGKWTEVNTKTRSTIISINADGASRKNPGPAAIGVVIKDETKNTLQEYKSCIGNTTNNIAEYSALIKALQLAAGHTREKVHIFMDSEFVIRQVLGTYRIKADHLMPLFQEVKKAEQCFKEVTYNTITRNNKYQIRADELANEALDGK
jgi:ribonuclease HI